MLCATSSVTIGIDNNIYSSFRLKLLKLRSHFGLKVYNSFGVTTTMHLFLTVIAISLSVCLYGIEPLQGFSLPVLLLWERSQNSMWHR